jgi:hypothetical protein
MRERDERHRSVLRPLRFARRRRSHTARGRASGVPPARCAQRRCSMEQRAGVVERRRRFPGGAARLAVRGGSSTEKAKAFWKKGRVLFHKGRSLRSAGGHRRRKRRHCGRRDAPCSIKGARCGPRMVIHGESEGIAEEGARLVP